MTRYPIHYWVQIASYSYVTVTRASLVNIAYGQILYLGGKTMIGEVIFGVAIYAGCQKAVDAFPVLRKFFHGNIISDAVGESVKALNANVTKAVVEGFNAATSNAGQAQKSETRIVDVS